MVKHIVMFKLKEKTAENMEAAVSTLRRKYGQAYCYVQTQRKNC